MNIETLSHHSLSSPQKGIWFDQIRHLGTPLYNVGGFVRIEGSVNPCLLEKAVNRVIQENDALRTVVYEDTPLPVQTFPENTHVSVEMPDFSEQDDPHQQAIQWMENELVTPFQLYGQHLFKFALIKASKDCYYGFCKYHHLIIDGWGISLVFQRIAQQYDALAAGAGDASDGQARYSYVDFVQADQKYLESNSYQQHEQYWQTKYRELPDPLIAPRMKVNGTPIPSRRQTLTLNWDFYSQLIAFAKDNKATTFHLMIGVLYCYFMRTGETEEFVIGLPVLNRNSAAFKRTVGLFTGVTPARFSFGTTLNFLELMQAISQTLRKDYRHQRFPLGEINKQTGLLKQGREQLFDISLSYQKHDYLNTFAGNTAKVFTLPNGFEQSALAIAIEEYQENQDVRVTFDYNLAMFDDADIKRIIARFESLLGEVIARPELPIQALNLMPEAERQKVLVEFNNTAASYPADKTIVDLFEQQVETTPLSVAVVFEDQQLTYQELNTRANQLAHHMHTLGVKPEVLVGICVQRSLEMLIGLLGILKAGGAYVPLDPSYPQERLAFMLEDSQVAVLLTQQKLIAKLPAHQAQVICLDTEQSIFSKPNTSNLVSGVQPDNLAYVIYTSGSTGKPKGVLVEHQGLCNLAQAQIQRFNVQPDSRVLQFVSFSFDVATADVAMTLCAGATLCLAPNDSASHISSLIALLREQGITHVEFSSAILAALPFEDLPHLQALIVGGDTCFVDVVAQWSQGRRFFNAYGPTEATVCATVFEYTAGQTTLPIGRPLDNIQVYILDKHQNPVPLGVSGELYIGGIGLARGYLNRPELTAEKFIPNPFIEFGRDDNNPKSERLYKTGDLARYLPDGNLEFLGRIDNQVKIRCFRIELGEIEAMLARHSAVQENVVIVHQESQDKRLVAYFVPKPEHVIEPTELRRFLTDRLPDYMIPKAFVPLEAMPLTPNGKVDRRALAQLSIKHSQLSEDTFVAPRTPEEELLAGIWADILGVERVGIHDNFFELGGDSILSIQVVAKANQAGLQLSPGSTFQHQTIAELVTLANTPSTCQAKQGLVTGLVPLTPIHHWFFEQHSPEPQHYNQSVLLEGPSIVNTALLEQIVQQLLRHHDALRMRFTRGESGWQATQVNPEEKIPFEVIDLSKLSAHTQQHALETAANQQQASLNLSEGPLMRVVLFIMGTEQPSRLLIIIHHLAIDGVSWRILLEDLQTAYRCQGEVIQLPAKTMSFQTWSDRLTEYAQSPTVVAELDHWLSHAVPTPLPVDTQTVMPSHRSADNTVASTAHLKVSLTALETRTLLNEVPQAYNTLINDVLLTALVQSFAQWTKQQRLLIDLEGHGREALFEDADISRTVGWFTSLFPVSLDLSKTAFPGEALKSIKEQLRRIPNHGLGYGLLRYLNTETSEHLKKRPQAEVCFNYLGQFDQQLSGDSLFRIAKEDSGQMHSPLGNRQYLLEINGLITEGQLQLDWTYSEHFHHRETIERLAQAFIGALKNLIAHCQSPEAVGYTSSDFPLADLNQDELDLLTTQQGKNIGSIYPLSHTQAGMLFHSLYAPESGIYFEQLSCTLIGTLNPTAFQQAWQQVVERHPVLRSFFIWENRRQPLQVVCRSVNLPWHQHDWRSLTATAQQLETFLSSDREQGFVLNQAPLMRCALIQLTENTHQFVWSHHHLLMDGWCLPLILKEVFADYEAISQGLYLHLEPSRPYQDYIGWLQQQDRAQAETFWRKKLNGFVAPTPLSVEIPSTVSVNEKGHRQQELKLPKETTEALQTLAREQHLTLNTLVQGAWALLLSRYSGEDDIVFGTTVSGRQMPLVGVEAMVGLFINTLPLRVHFSADTALIPWLQELQRQQVEAEHYSYTPLVDIQSWSDVPRGTTLFDSILVFENYPVDESLRKPSSHLTISNVQVFEQTNYPLTVICVPGQELSLKIIYDTARFEAATVGSMVGHFQTLLESIVTHSAQPVSELPLLTKAEQHQLLIEWNDTAAVYPDDLCIHQLFEAQVEKTPDAIAVIFEDQQLTYQELNTRANQLAHHLQTLGVGPEVLVGICVERSLEMLIGLLGILKAGGGYVPLDPSYPKERLALILEDANVSVLLTQEGLIGELPQHKGQIICLDSNREILSKGQSSNLVSGVQAQHLAYVIYTSGSTGRPKGVAIEHHSPVVLLNWAREVFTSEHISGVLASTSICFDLSVFEIFVPLSWGGKIILVENALHLSTLSADSNVTLVNTVPSAIAELVRTDSLPASVQVVNLAGETLQNELVQNIYQQETIQQVFNLYGPSEDTTYSTFTLVKKGQTQSPTIGRPIANTQVYLLDSHQLPVPVGVHGELHIGGAGLARGYLNRPELTPERFIPNPFSDDPQARLYKTGDLARYLPDGNIEYLGRLDHQVKIRGFRIELGEIEALLSQHPNVQETAIIVKEYQPGDKRLVAYITSDLIPDRIPYQSDCLVEWDGKSLALRTHDISNSGIGLQQDKTTTLKQGQEIRLRLQLPNESEVCWLRGKVAWSRTLWAGIELTLTPDEQTRLARRVEFLLEEQGLLNIVQRILVGNLRRYLEEKLPNYMVPAHFVLLTALPLTPNGKVDRRALPDPEHEAPSVKKDFLPQTEIENEIAAVWQEVLQIKKVGIYDHFFEIGGHSLLIAQVQSKLQDSLGQQITMVELFEHPTIHALAEHLSDKKAKPLSTQPKPQNRVHTRTLSNEIAIIGMAGRFPGANDIEAFWQNLQDGVESITFFSDEEVRTAGIDSATLNQPHYVKAGGVLSDVEQFDAAFFDFSPKEAEMTDPQHRLFLECAWQAIEHAGIEPGTDESAIGVYAGVGMNTYLLNNLSPNPQFSDSVDHYQLMIGNGNDFLPTRVSYKLNLKGPSVNVQTACSTSLVAVHTACKSLLDGECDVALAGGVSIRVPHKAGYLYQEGMIMSPDGHCRAFDANAQGTVGGNGVGVVVLKRLEDALADGDCIHAIIKGSAINNDGSVKVGYTAPSVEGQSAVIAEAQANAGVKPDTISYLETHGTGTKLGDPIEMAALNKAFQAHTQKQGFCAIGSVKTNIGHTDAAAGVAGLIKTVQALKHQCLPPSLHFEHPNPQIDFANSPFYVNNTRSEWKTVNGTPRRAGVSSFGIGGTNAHMVLEEAPTPQSSSESRPWQLLVLSAKTASALETATANLATYLEHHPENNLADVAYTLSKGRKAFSHRRVLMAQNTDEAVRALQSLDPTSVLTHSQASKDRPVVFMFSGQGTQYVNMGLELYQTEPSFREEIDRCSAYLKPHLELDLRQILYPSAEHILEAEQQLKQTAIAQPALFVIDYALAKLWMSWGIQPDAMIGHSLGEYVAACLSGVFSVEEALSLVAARGQLMQQLPQGAMLSVSLSEAEVQPLLGPALSLAAINTHEQCVVSGVTEAVEALENHLTREGIACRRLQTSHAFHSHLMDPILASFTKLVKQVRLCPPQMPYLSNVSGNWITVEETLDHSYWANHLRHTVHFAEGMQHLLKNPRQILLEIGPGRTLTTLARRHPDKATEQVVLSSLRHPKEQQSDEVFLLNTLGQLWLAGRQINWSGFYANEHRHRLPLPTYPFERQRYWVAPPSINQKTQLEALPEKESANKVDSDSTSLYSRHNVLNTYVAPRNELEQTIANLWAQCLGIEQVGIYDNFFDLGGDSLEAVQLISKLRETLQVAFSAHSLLNAPTIAALAQLLEETTASLSELSHQAARQTLPPSLVEIQAGNGLKPPLFLMHPVGGHVYFYRDLAHHLGSDQAVYGLQAQGLDGETAPLNRLEDMATQYIEALRTLQPEGPYFLGGSSFGGMLAFEAAQQLQALGQQVALLAMIDTPGPDNMPMAQFDDDAEILAYMLEVGANVSVSLDKLRKTDDLLSVIKQMKIANRIPPDWDMTQLHLFLHLFKMNIQAIFSYTPRVYPGRVLFFRAKEQDAFNAQHPEQAWIELAGDGMELYVVPGNHITMNASPHVQFLAKRLRGILKLKQAR